jgi:hypothetical protein
MSAEPAPEREAHIEEAIDCLREAVWRVVRGLECLDVELISSAKEKLDSADIALMNAIRLRGERKRFEEKGA